MIRTETLPDGRTHTYSDTYKIRQMDTGVIYEDAVDSVPHSYEETDIPQEYSGYTEEQLIAMTNDELRDILADMGISGTMTKANMIALIMSYQNS